MSLEPLFYPKTVAVVGVSRKDKSIGREILRNLIEFNYEGRVYPVNPSAFSVNSVRCYESLTAIPEESIDLVIVVVPSKYVYEVMQEAAGKGVKAAVIITAGFKEIGETGRAMEEKIHTLTKANGIRVIGPNCMGILNGHAPYLNATFAPLLPKTGEIGFISQSGALGVVVMEYATHLNLGFSKFVSLGNKMDIDANDMLNYLVEDADTKVILAYLESFNNPSEFVRIARKVTKRKPVLMLKSGKTEQGAKAASSHTGALAGKDNIISAAMASAGIIRVNSVEELFDSAMGFLKCNLPSGNRVAVLTNAGGPGTLATDALISYGMEINELSKKTQEALREVIPPEASSLNPVDLIASADAERYGKSLQILLEDEDVDSVLVIFVPPLMIQTVQVADYINGIISTTDVSKPVICCFMGRNQLISQRNYQFPIYEFPESGARVIRDLYEYRKWLYTPAEDQETLVPEANKAKVFKILKGQKTGEWIPQHLVQEILELYGLRFPKSKIVQTLDEVFAAADNIKYPVVMKIATTELTHKTDVGGVFLDLRTNDEIRTAWKSIQKVYKRFNVSDKNVLVQSYYSHGVEIALGVSIDPQFGHVVMLGSGGIFIELMKDVIFRIPPLTRRDVEEMVYSLRAYPLLLGFRGGPAVDMEALIEGVLRISELVTDFPAIQELDLNPTLALPDGLVTLDARIRL